MAENDREKSQSKINGVDPRIARHGGLSYLEIPAVNPWQSADFYERVLGWKIQRGEPDSTRFEDATGHLIGRWWPAALFHKSPVCCRTSTLIA